MRFYRWSRTFFFCSQCRWIHYSNPLPVAVCAALKDNRMILAVKRKNAPGKDQWALPGGFIEAGENPENACLRELKEETGVVGRVKRLIEVYERDTGVYGSLLVIGYQVEVINDEIIIDSNEIIEADFFHRDSLPQIYFPGHRRLIEAALDT